MEKVFPILQPWLEKHLSELAQFKIRLQFRQLINQSQMEWRLVFQHHKKTELQGARGNVRKLDKAIASATMLSCKMIYC
jgi:hypothetical protein